MAVQKSFVNNVVGVDLGFGFTQTMGRAGRKVFPSLVAPASNSGWDAGLNSVGGYRIQWGDNDYLVGEVAAVKSRTAFGNRSRDRINDPEVMALFYAALADQFPDGADNIIVMTGLPIRWMADKEIYKHDLPGTHTATVNGREVSWHIVEVVPAPQGFGAICDVAISLDGAKAIIRNQAMLTSWSAVADIGTLTMNVFTFNSNTWVEQSSDSLEFGMSWLYREVRSILDDQVGVSYEDHEIDKIIRDGYVDVQGQRVNVEDMISPALDKLAREQARAIKTAIGGDYSKVSQIVVAGGGAHRLGELLVSYLAHDGAVVAEAPGWANAVGFYKWGVLRTQ